MKLLKSLFLGSLLIAAGLFYACDENGDLLLFSIQDDINLGQQVAAEIEADPAQFPLLPRSGNEQAYAYLESMLDEILSSDEVTYKDDFPWKVNIIDDDQTLNAFATPGGQLYVYTGLIFFLNQQDDLAGVLGHEVAHSDRRHSSKQLQRVYGISVLLQVIAGGQSELTQQILGSLVGVGALEFSRDAEREADDYSVRYLSDTPYACNGAAAFFEKLISRDQAGGDVPFLSTHPQPDDRVADINALADELACSTESSDPNGSSWLAFQNLLR